MRLIDDITSFIFVEDAPQKRDVILVPGSLQWQHVETAARMYREGYADRIAVCGGYSYQDGRFAHERLVGTPYEGIYASEAAYFRHILRMNGVPDAAILCEDQSQNTFENAAFASKLMVEKGIAHQRIMLCCQAFHARRALMTFERYFQGSLFTVVPTETLGINRRDWHRDEAHFLTVMGEVEKCGRFFQDMFPLLPQD